MYLKYLFLSILFFFSISMLSGQVEKELLLTFDQSNSALDITSQRNLEKSLQAFLPNSPIEVLFYKEISTLEVGQFNPAQTDKKTKLILNFLKSKQVQIKSVLTESIENDGNNNNNSMAIVLSGIGINTPSPNIVVTNEISIDSPRTNTPSPEPILLEASKPEPSSGEEFFPSEMENISFERAAELFLSPIRKEKKIRPLYH